ncbi:MAG: alpha/beta hydrolase [Pseudomonadota bacterium]
MPSSERGGPLSPPPIKDHPALERRAPFGAPAPETAALAADLEAKLKDAPDPWTVPVDLVRRLRAEGKGVLPIDGPRPESVWVETPPARGPAAPGRVRLSTPEGGGEGPWRGLYLHIHGGGWTFGAPEQFDGRNLRLARASGFAVASAAYRLAPEHKWPAGLEDCVAAARWALSVARARGAPLVIGGESAGAHLAAATLLRLRADGIAVADAVRAAVLIYGCFDLAMTPSMAAWGPRCLVLSTPIVAWFVGNLLDEGADARAPEISPLRADLSGMPPALFQVGDADPLLDDTLFMAERWRAAGAEAHLAVWPGAPHAFDYFDRPADALPIAAQAQDLSAEFIQSLI